MNSENERMDSGKKTFEELLEQDGSFCWTNVGRSMLPLIREGRDVIVIRKRPEGRLKKYDAVLFRRPGVTGRGAYVLHRICRVCPDGTYDIVGDNCIRRESVKEENILGILTAVRRNGKTIRADSLPYLLYSRLSCFLFPLRFLLFRSLDLARLIRNSLRGH